MRGLNVALVERQDFAGATSSRSSKLIHGGLRYLPQGELRLVRTALAERERLRRVTAPHWSRRCAFYSRSIADEVRDGSSLGWDSGSTICSPAHPALSAIAGSTAQARSRQKLMLNPQALAGGAFYTMPGR